MSSPAPTAHLYRVLEISPGASASEIKDAYRRMVRQHHPDANPDRREECEQRIKEIIEAYTTLNDPARRERYDSGQRLHQWEERNGAEKASGPSSSDPLLSRVRCALGLSPTEFAARLGISETTLQEMELRDDMPKTPIQLRTFSHLCDMAAQQLESQGHLSFAADIRTLLNRKKSQRAFYK